MNESDIEKALKWTSEEKWAAARAIAAQAPEATRELALAAAENESSDHALVWAWAWATMTEEKAEAVRQACLAMASLHVRMAHKL